ncbi:MAG TPA: methylamine dehydrogenase light chain [Steroidobacteraceae bacterium]|nr:methylamine dehydrogenase light chain [Steroidobacteraceae bacterium]
MSRLDRIVESLARGVARRSSRRHFLGSLGALLCGAAVMPLLPVARGAPAPAAGPAGADPGDPGSCDYWRHCAIDGFLCSCCGGNTHSCPPGTEPSAITWVGTCHNPGDGHDYIVSYNDCCGKASCGRCLCNRNENDKPLYMPFASNDYNWCAGSQSGIAYNCSTARIVGRAR